MIDGTMLLAGIVGSTAYGLAGPDSDIDRLGVFAVPTVRLHGLGQPTETVVTSKPDGAYHELAKFCRLALSGNPTVLELLWLPDDLYETTTDVGEALIKLRADFLAAPRVRDAFLGYATQQFHRLRSRGDGTFGSDLGKRTAKHARHLLRLCRQGLELYSTGTMTVRVPDPQALLDFGASVAAGDIDLAERALAEYREKFDATHSPLPEHPDAERIEQLVVQTRARYFTP